jgi:nicotinate phosphoribosyltransferase
MPGPLRENPLRSALFTDLYELTMAQAYQAESMEQPAVFELFFRKMPAQRNYMVAAGLEDVLGYLENLHFTAGDLEWLRRRGQFSQALLDRLARLRFTGDVYALLEGTIVFPNEPLVQVVAPIIESQLVETFVLNQVHFQSLLAAKAARVVTAAAGRAVIDFGSRRAHGTDAAMKVARACYLEGGAGTSNVLAGKVYGVPVFGTMAHSYIQAHDDELAAFAAFAAEFPQTTLLVDTYDTLAGVRKVIELSRKLGDQFRVQAIRLDSGDLGELAKVSRKMLDEAGLTQVRIFASSGLDEYEIAGLVAGGAPIDSFGVGTKLAVTADVPYLDLAYKLVEYAGQPRMKLSTAKLLYPGRKQVFRRIENGRLAGDTIGCFDERLPDEPLLRCVMQNGQRQPAGRATLEEARQHALHEVQRLPEHLRGLKPTAQPYPVSISPALEQQMQSLRRSLGE